MTIKLEIYGRNEDYRRTGSNALRRQ
uniref:Uncharacterized protein n=1 Tax=Romanomermis culicivorax TaxID=13658 RepID=A0A915HNP6_ROMCU